MLETVYAIMHKTRNEAYVGRTYQPLEVRFRQHLRDAANVDSEKRLAEALRHEPEGFVIVECERSETASEASWIEQFHAAGYVLLNAVGGNRAKPKQRDTEAERRWRELNDAGFKATNGSAAISSPDEPNTYERVCAQLVTDGVDPWARFAAAEPAYVALLRSEVEALRAARAAKTSAMI